MENTQKRLNRTWEIICSSKTAKEGRHRKYSAQQVIRLDVVNTQYWSNRKKGGLVLYTVVDR